MDLGVVGSKAWTSTALLAVLVASVSVAALDARAGGDAATYATWPLLGVAAAMHVVAGRRWRGGVVVVQTVAVGGSLALSGVVPWWAGLLGSVVVTAPALLAAEGLRPGGAALRRFSENEVDAYHGVTATAGLLCAVLAVAAVALTGTAEPGRLALIGLIALLAATTSQLVVLPLVLRGAEGVAWRSGELWGQRLLLAVVACAVFLPVSAEPLAFLMFPVLGWAALRAQALETYVQVLLLSVVVLAATYAGRGPFAGIDTDPGVSALIVHLYIASVCYLLPPLAVNVRRLLVVSGQATRTATTVNRMLDSATGTVFLASDRHGVVTHVNTGAEQALGYTAQDLIGRTTDHLYSDAEVLRQAAYFGVVEKPEALYAATVRAQVASDARRDWEVTRVDGRTRMLSLHVSEMTDPTNEVVGYIASGEDITERLRAETALEAAFEHERASVRALRQADLVKQELVSTVSHELRTPITSIAGFVELLAHGTFGELDPRQADAVERIERNTARLRDLVEDLLTLSASESGTAPISLAPVDLRDVVRCAHEAVSRLLDPRRLEVDVQVPDDAVVVLGDVKALERAVVNLWSNAIKFTPDGGSVAVTVARRSPEGADGRGVITVADTGMGIAPEDQAAVFTRFFRTTAAGERAIQGTGLGLSIVSGIAEQHGGEVTLDSTPGAGTTIELAIPLADSATAE